MKPNHFLLALQFLTIFPVKISSDIEDKDYGRALLYFPIIGLLIGIVLSIALSLFGFLPNLVIGAIILIIAIVITGGIHLDGFADTCDGFYGAKPKEKVLEIMRESQIGVMGAIGIVGILLLKFTLIVSIPRDILWKSLIMMAVFARWSQVLACFSSKYARMEGKARYFIEYASKKGFLIGTVFTILIFLLVLGLKGVVLLVVSFLPILLFINYVKKRINGMTGDTIGAVSEIAEVLILLGCLFYQR